jgi:hypothetical protein
MSVAGLLGALTEAREIAEEKGVSFEAALEWVKERLDARTRRKQCDSIQAAGLLTMDWLDNLIDRGNEAAKAKQQPEPAAVPDRTVHAVWVQTRAPTGSGLGGTEAGYYFVEGGLLVMCSEDGTPTGKTHVLKEGENPKAIAGRLRRSAWSAEQGESDFNRPLGYSRLGNA